MLRILLWLSLGFCAVGHAAPDETDEARARISRNYFESQNLPYSKPRGCGASCSITADFNDDGVADLAALYEYSGTQPRRDNWNLDLVIVYSVRGSVAPRHVVFTHVGQTRNGQPAARLGKQNPGSVRLLRGRSADTRSSIKVTSTGGIAIGDFPTIYWDGETFRALPNTDD